MPDLNHKVPKPQFRVKRLEEVVQDENANLKPDDIWEDLNIEFAEFNAKLEQEKEKKPMRESLIHYSDGFVKSLCGKFNPLNRDEYTMTYKDVTCEDCKKIVELDQKDLVGILKTDVNKPLSEEEIHTLVSLFTTYVRSRLNPAKLEVYKYLLKRVGAEQLSDVANALAKGAGCNVKSVLDVILEI